VKFGLATLATDRGIGPDELALAAEERGFESLWFGDHSHIPVDRQTAWPGGAELPEAYYRVLAPMVALMAAAAATTTLKVATGVALVAQRDPIHLAKEVASLDHLSHGRVIFGVGAGWNVEEMVNHGTDPTTRFSALEERVAALKEIWTTDEAEFHGATVDFDPIYSWPKPVQRPHPPIHVGGAAPAGMRRALRIGDGWIPMANRGDADFARDMAQLPEVAEGLGRTLDGFEVSVYGAPTGAAPLRELATMGVSRGIFILGPAPAEATLRHLDKLASTVASIQADA
jgi:probable F420-dependent oxidoreductase